MVRVTFAVAALGLTSGIVLYGQTAKTPEVMVATAPAKAVESLVNRFERDVTHAAQAMPAEKYAFTPAALHLPGAKFDGVRTFADEVKHVAQSNYATAANIAGTEPSADLETIGALQSKEEILAALAGSFAAVHQAIATITVANENQPVEDVGVGANQSKISLAAWVAVHGYDHYGQMVEYLRMNGIVL